MLFRRRKYEAPTLKRLIACKGELPCIFRQSFALPGALCQKCDTLRDLMQAHGAGYRVALRLAEKIEP